ncbi:hypothetical protein AcV5_005743 [Taiwanofungus camphoratus]|nr:hypothetical protein AcV5_005743 [Antrodia cinnamomea]
MSILLTSLTMFLTSRIQHYQPGGKRWLTMGSNEVWLGAAILVGTHSRQCRDDLLKRSGDCFQWSPSSRATCDLASGLQTARRGALIGEAYYILSVLIQSFVASGKEELVFRENELGPKAAISSVI